MLLLSISLSFKKWNNEHSDSIAFLNLRKHTGIIFKTGDHAVVITDLVDSDKNYRYSIQPYLDSCQVNTIKSVALNADLRQTNLLKKSNLVQFDNKKILLFDKQLQNVGLPGKLNLDYLYISGNPGVNLGLINKFYSYNLLIVDNTNSNSTINSIENQAGILGLNFKLLRRNKAVVIVSN